MKKMWLGLIAVCGLLGLTACGPNQLGKLLGRINISVTDKGVDVDVDHPGLKAKIKTSDEGVSVSTGGDK